jgi:ATP-dependent Lon protease
LDVNRETIKARDHVWDALATAGLISDVKLQRSFLEDEEVRIATRAAQEISIHMAQDEHEVVTVEEEAVRQTNSVKEPPIEAPIENITKKLAEKPIETPIETPVEEPIKEQSEKRVVKLHPRHRPLDLKKFVFEKQWSSEITGLEGRVEKRVERRVERRVESRSERKIEKRASSRTEKRVSSRVEKQVEPVQRQTEKPVEKPAEVLLRKFVWEERWPAEDSFA